MRRTTVLLLSAWLWLAIQAGLVHRMDQRLDRPLQTQPEQVHLSLGEEPDEMVVTWVTFDPTDVSVVEYGESGLELSATGEMTSFKDPGAEGRVEYVHVARMRKLRGGARYQYHVGSPVGGWSELFSFNALRTDADWSPRVAVFGDMGNENPQSLPRLQEETQREHLDAALHVGDFAYNMEWEDGRIGDQFLNQVQAFAAYIPYMASVGNHESGHEFLHYRRKFSMPGGTESMYYSYNLGPAHIMSISSEFYYYSYGASRLEKQYNW